MTVNSAIDTTYTGVRYTISDPLDVEPIAMWQALVKLAEANLVRNLRAKDYREREVDAVRAVRAAMENDQRQITNNIAGLGEFEPVIATTAE